MWQRNWKQSYCCCYDKRSFFRIKQEVKEEIDQSNLAVSDVEEVSGKEDSNRCDRCGKILSRSRDMKRHKISCQKLSTTTKKSQNEVQRIKRHRRTRDEIIPQFFCDICDRGFTRKHDMQKHQSQLHANEMEPPKQKPSNLQVLDKCRNRSPNGRTFYSCDFCQKTFAQTYNLMRHRTIHTGVAAYCCHICGKRFRICNGLKRHIECFHNRVKKFACEVCKRGFTSRAGRDEHMNIHTNNRPYVCEECGKCFKQKASLHVHKMFHTDLFKFQCNSCEKKFRRAGDLTIHSWVHTGHRPHECDICKMAFRLKHDLKRHMTVHQKVKECVCSECGLTFSQERYLKVHRRIHDRRLVLVKEELEMEETAAEKIVDQL